MSKLKRWSLAEVVRKNTGVGAEVVE
jgi:hypothetical protein